MKTLLIDIETSPTLAWVWRRFKENISLDQVEADGYVLCACWKWIGERKVHSAAIPDTYGTDSDNDRDVMRKVWKVLDEADIVIAHNGNKFDIPTINARFLYYGWPPPSPYKKVDTLLTARRLFRMPSNSAAGIGKYLNLKQKKQKVSFELWKGCMHGSADAWKRMVNYCKQDVRELEEMYLLMRPWDDQHPNVSLYSEKVSCPACGSSELQSRGWAYTNAMRYRRFQCKDCGHWARGRKSEMAKKDLVQNAK